MLGGCHQCFTFLSLSFYSFIKIKTNYTQTQTGKVGQSEKVDFLSEHYQQLAGEKVLYPLTHCKGSTHKINPHRATCKLDVIEIQLSRLQIYNLHQVRSHLKD